MKGERKGRTVGTGTLSTRASAVRCVKARQKNTFFFLNRLFTDYFYTLLHGKAITARLVCVCARAHANVCY